MTEREIRMGCLMLATQNATGINVLHGTKFDPPGDVVARAQAYFDFVRRGNKTPAPAVFVKRGVA